MVCFYSPLNSGIMHTQMKINLFRFIYNGNIITQKLGYIDKWRTKSQNLNVSRLVSCLKVCTIHISQVSSREWRYSWSSADRRCSSYICVMNNLLPTKLRLILQVWRYLNRMAPNEIYNQIICIEHEMVPNVMAFSIIAHTLKCAYEWQQQFRQKDHSTN